MSILVLASIGNLFMLKKSFERKCPLFVCCSSYFKSIVLGLLLCEFDGAALEDDDAQGLLVPLLLRVEEQVAPQRAPTTQKRFIYLILTFHQMLKIR